MRGTVGSDKEGDMGQMILCAVAMVALCWWASVTPRRTVIAPVRVDQDFSLRGLRKRLCLTEPSGGTGRGGGRPLRLSGRLKPCVKE